MAGSHLAILGRHVSAFHARPACNGDGVCFPRACVPFLVPFLALPRLGSHSAVVSPYLREPLYLCVHAAPPVGMQKYRDGCVVGSRASFSRESMSCP